MTHHFRAQDIASTEMTSRPLGLPTASPISGDIMTRSQNLYTSDNADIKMGTWECEPGLSRWEFTDRGEFIHVISGRMIVQEDGGQPVELGANSSAAFPIGWRGTWNVIDTLRKVFVIYAGQ